MTGVLVAVWMVGSVLAMLFVVCRRRKTRSSWPRTFHDRIDAKFAAEYADKNPNFVQLWRERTICGCGDVLQTDDERRDGVCETCVELGTRTPRPMEVLER